MKENPRTVVCMASLLTLLSLVPVSAAGKPGVLDFQPKAGGTAHATPGLSRHTAADLEYFMMPEILIQGLTPDAALAKLEAVYQETCSRTGEVPLDLSFSTPPGNARKLDIRLPSAPLSDSVVMLASLTGMDAPRKGTTWRLQPYQDEGTVSNTLGVPPDFQQQLESMLLEKNQPGRKQTIASVLARIGLISDPRSSVVLSANGSLVMVGFPAAEGAAIASFVQTFSGQKPLQVKFSLCVVDTAKGDRTGFPADGFLTAAQDRRLAKALETGESPGKGWQTNRLPSATQRFGRNVALEMVESFPPLRPGESDRIASRMAAKTRAMLGGTAPENPPRAKPLPGEIGIVTNMSGTLEGLKIRMDMDYTSRTGETDPTTGKPRIHTRATFADTGYWPDGSTRVMTHQHPDGTSTTLLASAQVIDATGRPWRD